MPVVTISDEVFERLQAVATPLVDTPEALSRDFWISTSRVRNRPPAWL